MPKLLREYKLNNKPDHNSSSSEYDEEHSLENKQLNRDIRYL